VCVMHHTVDIHCTHGPFRRVGTLEMKRRTIT
jgi:hypothetical protein